MPRQNIFIGTTNDVTWNKDLTGARRFFPIRCGKIDLAAIRRDRDQLWAEALAMFREGEQWWLTPEETRLAAKEQAARFEADEWLEGIARYIEKKDQVTIGEILGNALSLLERARWDQRFQNRVANCHKAMGQVSLSEADQRS